MFRAISRVSKACFIILSSLVFLDPQSGSQRQKEPFSFIRTAIPQTETALRAGGRWPCPAFTAPKFSSPRVYPEGLAGFELDALVT
jgi:hypothetical protein